ncbi:protein LAZ1 [Tanacetum coccineum]
MFDIGNDKAPRPDGYTSAFFKKAWDIVGIEVCDAVRDFFLNGQILKEINQTFIALIPKIPTPLRINDYHPISCCNVIYKCISKTLTNRIIEGVKDVVSENQSAFNPGRNISDNILITQELMHNYHRNRRPPRCAFKVDIQKAYDTVDWRFLGKRGLRQRDLLSPNLFTLVMEVLNLMLKRRVRLSDSFRYHHHCDNLQIINLFFADDLFIFARGDVEFARVIMESLDEFKSTSGLVLSIPKSTAFFCNVLSHVKTVILNIMPFSEGELPAIPMNDADMSWGWRKLLQLRELVRPYIWTKLGNGNKASVWYDIWDPQCPLIKWLTPRDISREGFNLQSHVADLLSNNGWLWPQDWLRKAPNLGLIYAPRLDNATLDTHCDRVFG